MALITERYADKMAGVLGYFDRLIIYKYCLTTLGRLTVVPGLKMKNLLIIPELAQAPAP